ncbi:hypothetical protein C8J56DRAFT_1043803 [Mycena floridula]|nr:hypothetical protein C8J56DRAFT_1043803 [Mycena floridula]
MSGTEMAGSSSKPRPAPLRTDPSEIIGRVLKRISRSPHHPVLTLDFTDQSTFQVLVDGYDPIHRGVPKELEMDPLLTDLFLQGPNSEMELTIVDCALITLSDKAFQRKQINDSSSPSNSISEWDQRHLGVAFKFAGESQNARWHCVWATLQEYEQGSCVFRSYNDVYLNRLERTSPRKSKWRKQSISN